MLDIIEGNHTEQPLAALELLQRLEKIRRSATRDCREAALTIMGLVSKGAPVQVAVVQQHGTVNIRGQVAARQPRKLQRG